MEIVRTTPNIPIGIHHQRETETATPPDTFVEAASQPEEISAASSPPSVIDIASARSRAWLMNRLLRTIDASIEFTVQESNGEIVVRLHDKTSGELLRHFPVDAFPDVAAVLDRQQGALVTDMA